MISGTYVLTDSIDSAFDQIFTDVREGSDVVITGKSAFDLSDGSGVTEPTLADSLLDEVRGLDGVAQAEGSVDSDSTSLIGKDNKAIVFGGAPNLGFAIADGDSTFNPLRLVEGKWPGPGPGRDRLGRREQEGLRDRRRDRGPGRRAGSSAPHLGDRRVRLEPLDRRRDARRLRPSDRAAALREGGPPRRDRGRGEARGHVAAAPRGDPPDPPVERAGGDGPPAGGGGRVRDERVHRLPPGLPARVRRDRALRRLLRDRELALDHDRAADPRVRDAPDDRRLAPPGPHLGHPRVVRRRRRRLRGGALPRPAPREGPLRALRRRRLHAAERRPPASRRAR